MSNSSSFIFLSYILITFLFEVVIQVTKSLKVFALLPTTTFVIVLQSFG